MDENSFSEWLAGEARSLGLRFLGALAVLIIGGFLIKAIIRFFPDGKRNNSLDPTVKGFVRSFLRIALWVLLIVCVVAILGVPMASVVAAVASAGLTVGLAMQGSLSNLAGGLMILLFRPYGVGDYIKTSAAEGTVFELGIFYTILRTADNKRVTIPNGSMMNNVVTNYSREDTRRIDLDLPLPYKADLSRAIDIASGEIAGNALILQTPEPFIRLTALSASAQTLSVRVWVRSADYAAAESALLQGIRDAFARAGIPPIAG